MRILIAVHGFPPTHTAGAERQAERMAQWLTRHGHEVEIFAIESVSTPGFKVEEGVQDGFPVHRLSYDVKESHDPFRNLYDNPRIGEAVRNILAQKHFDVMHLVSGYMLGGQVVFAARRMDVPVVVSLMEYWFMCPQINLVQPTGHLCSGPESDNKCMRCLMEDKRRFRIPAQASPRFMDAFWGVAQHLPFAHEMKHSVERRRIHLREALNAADRVICNSNFIISKFAEFGFETDRFTFIRQGLATAHDDSIHIDHIEQTPLRVGYIGQIKFHKGVDLVIDAAISLLDDGYALQLDLWGSETETPDYVNDLKQRTAAYPTIHWNGRYSGGQVWDVLGAMDVLVIPSRWYENSPNVILEAFYAGVPVITTNLGGMSELVEHEKSGLVFELNNPADLAHQLTRLIKEPELMNRLRAGIPSVKTLDEEMEELLVVYGQLV